jgi:hypothetical protein
MLQGSGIQGTARYTLPDGSVLDTVLALDLARTVGPLPDGPVEASLNGTRCTLTSRIERAIDVADLEIELGDARIESLGVERRLEPGQSIELEVPVGAVHAAPVTELAPGDPPGLTEIRSFVEDVHTNVAFINLMNYANHGLRTLSLEARIRDVEGTQALELEETAPVSSLEFVLPLTRYLARPVLEFAVAKTALDGTRSVTPWLAWDLTEQGNVVGLSWETHPVAERFHFKGARRQIMAMGMSIHIGLNVLDNSVYGDEVKVLTGCVNDARDMQMLAASQGFQTTLMTDEAATADAVIEAISGAAQSLRSGDISAPDVLGARQPGARHERRRRGRVRRNLVPVRPDAPGRRALPALVAVRGRCPDPDAVRQLPQRHGRPARSRPTP